MRDLPLLNCRHVQPEIEIEPRKEAAAGGIDGDLAAASGDSGQHGQSPAARARRPESRVVAEVVADQGHGEVVQIGDDHAADLAGGASGAVGTKHLQEAPFGLQVQIRMLAALQGERPQFGAAVGVEVFRVPDVSNHAAQTGRGHVAEAHDGAQTARSLAVQPTAPQERLKIGVVHDQAARLLPAQPVELFFVAFKCAQLDRGTGSKRQVCRCPPAAAVGDLGGHPDHGELGLRVDAVPRLHAQQQCLLE